MHVPVPTALLLLVYTAALAVAATHLGTAGLPGGLLLAGLVLRGLLRARLRAPAPVGPALPDEAPATAT